MQRYTDCFRLILITRTPEIAAHAIRSGVDWIMVDLEILGKLERQNGRDTLISRHTLKDVATVRSAVTGRSLMVRINPWHDGSVREVEEVLARGADMVMLPMFRRVAEVAALVRTVRGRAGVVPLIETPEAADAADELAGLDGVERVHIGLNDLHLALRRRFMFELLADGTVERIACALRNRRMPFGIGGVARIGEGLLPAEYIIGEHVRLGSTAAILSRTFHRQACSAAALEEAGFAAELGRLRNSIERCRNEPGGVLDVNRAKLGELVGDVIASQSAAK